MDENYRVLLLSDLMIFHCKRNCLRLRRMPMSSNKPLFQTIVRKTHGMIIEVKKGSFAGGQQYFKTRPIQYNSELFFILIFLSTISRFFHQCVQNTVDMQVCLRSKAVFLCMILKLAYSNNCKRFKSCVRFHSRC